MLTAKDHYDIAYALDCAASSDFVAIEQHYQTAIALEPTNPQYQASWVNYLQTRARSMAASDAWDKAVAACPEAYDILHFPVAQLALHRASLDFARDVLDLVPPKKQDDKFLHLQKQLVLLLLAALNKYVMPNSIALDPHAWEKPHLSHQQRSGQELSKWFMGSIIYVNSNSVGIYGGLIRAKGEEPKYGWFEISRTAFGQASGETFEPQEKQHVELAWYGENDDLVIHLFPKDETLYFTDLPPIYPDPVRYIRNWTITPGENENG